MAHKAPLKGFLEETAATPSCASAQRYSSIQQAFALEAEMIGVNWVCFSLLGYCSALLTLLWLARLSKHRESNFAPYHEAVN